MPKRAQSPFDEMPLLPEYGWWRCFNVTDHVIPGFAHMKFSFTRNDTLEEGSKEVINKNVEQNNFAFSPELFGGQPVIRVGMADQSAQFFQIETSWFNGPTPILPHGFGKCTQTFPCRTLVTAQGADFAIRPGTSLKAEDDTEHPWSLKAAMILEEHHWSCVMMDCTDPRSRRDVLAVNSGDDAADILKPTVCWIRDMVKVLT